MRKSNLGLCPGRRVCEFAKRFGDPPHYLIRSDQWRVFTIVILGAGATSKSCGYFATR